MRLCVPAIVAGCLIACSTTPNVPVIEQGPDAEVTFDGLVRVERSRMQAAWMRPDMDLARYSKVAVAPPALKFRATRRTSRAGRASADGEAFPVSEQNQKKLAELLDQAFRDELAKSQHFETVEVVGPDVLVLRSALIDIVSFIPPTDPGRNDTFLSRVGEATLVIELADSQSDETLARAADRRGADPPTGVMWSNPVSSWGEIGRVARQWAKLLRERLDQFHELGRIDAASPE
jgi:hypothetical protein